MLINIAYSWPRSTLAKTLINISCFCHILGSGNPKSCCRCLCFSIYRHKVMCTYIMMIMGRATRGLHMPTISRYGSVYDTTMSFL